MNTLPFYKYFPESFEQGTAEFTLEEVGLYQRLLNYQWTKGSLPVQPQKLALIAKCSPKKFKTCWVRVSKYFLLESDLVPAGNLSGIEKRFVNEKLHLLKEEAKGKSTANAKTAKDAAESRKRLLSQSSDQANAPANASANAGIIGSERISERPHILDIRCKKEKTSKKPAQIRDLFGVSDYANKGEKIDFDSFLNLYPIRKDKDEAAKKWNALDSQTQKLILSRLPAFIAHYKPKGLKYTPGPIPFLNGKKWNDEFQVDDSNPNLIAGKEYPPGVTVTMVQAEQSQVKQVHLIYPLLFLGWTRTPQGGYQEKAIITHS